MYTGGGGPNILDTHSWLLNWELVGGSGNWQEEMGVCGRKWELEKEGFIEIMGVTPYNGVY